VSLSDLLDKSEIINNSLVLSQFGLNQIKSNYNVLENSTNKLTNQIGTINGQNLPEKYVWVGPEGGWSDKENVT